MGSSHGCLSLSSFRECPRSSRSTADRPNALNINRASEDEFLFLPGVTRVIARNLIEYRQRRDGFKQIEEILDVKGINRRLFARIRSDISLGLSSRTLLRPGRVNLNLATHDELCSLPGLTPIVVQRILHQRQRKGTFRFIEDLLQIKGIDYSVLAHIRPHVTVEQQRSHSSLIPADTLSLASLLSDTLTPEMQSLLLTSIPHRPVVKAPLAGFRFASWNLQQLTVEKGKNPGVREVIGRVILEQK